MKIKLTAPKMSRCAFCSFDSRRGAPAKGRARVAFGGGRVACGGVGRVGGRVGSRVSIGNIGSSHKSDKSESRDDLELHIVCFVCK